VPSVTWLKDKYGGKKKDLPSVGVRIASATFKVGDPIAVLRGDQSGVKGKVFSFQGDETINIELPSTHGRKAVVRELFSRIGQWLTIITQIGVSAWLCGPVDSLALLGQSSAPSKHRTPAMVEDLVVDTAALRRRVEILKDETTGVVSIRVDELELRRAESVTVSQGQLQGWSGIIQALSDDGVITFERPLEGGTFQTVRHATRLTL
jgi:ribosomal protein L24